MDETFSSIELITECLSDTERTSKIVEAIEKNVKPGDTVLDAGTGSAILAMAAAKAGAKKITAVEFDPYIAKWAYENVLRNKLEGVVNIFLSDARTVQFEEGTRFDVVIMEMLTTGMIDEHQVWATNNLHEKGYVDEKTRFIPQKQSTFITLTEKNFDDFGFEIRMVRHLWSWLPNSGMAFLSEKKLLNSISFNQVNELDFKTRVSFEVTKDGVINSVHLSSLTTIDENIEVGDTLALNAPVVFPLDEDYPVKKGEKIDLEISYIFGNGYRNLSIKKI